MRMRGAEKKKRKKGLNCSDAKKHLRRNLGGNKDETFKRRPKGEGKLEKKLRDERGEGYRFRSRKDPAQGSCLATFREKEKRGGKCTTKKWYTPTWRALRVGEESLS